MDKRLSALTAWIYSQFKASEPNLRPASSDASFRRYFRFAALDHSYIVMDAPPQRENTDAFVRTARRLHQIGLNVPEILAVDRAQGFVLLTDLGSTTYLDCLNADNVERLYGDALGALIVLQTGSYADPDFFPAYDKRLLMAEMELFVEWYVVKHAKRTLDSEQIGSVSVAFDNLCNSALEQPKVWVHRDFHSRNLMFSPHNNPGILDFQDAVTGPVTYDLVSLLRDCYIQWPVRRIREWALGYQALALQSGLPVGDDESRFIMWFDRMGIQRHIKVLGVFARLYHRDGKSDYLQDLPLVWHYLVTVCEDYEDLLPLRDLLLQLPPTSCTH